MGSDHAYEQKEYSSQHRLYTVNCIHAENLVYPAHWHEDFEFLYMEKGTVRIIINGVQYQPEQGQCVLIASGDVHSIFADAGKYSVIKIMIFSREIITHPVAGGSFIGENSLIDPLVKVIFQEQTLMEAEHSGEVQSALLNAAYHLLYRGRSIQIPSGSSDLTREILKYIDQYLGEDLSISWIAQVFHISESTLYRLIRKASGQSIQQYIISKRVSKARDFLWQGEKSMTEIAYRCGFGSIRTFNREFKLLTGVSPRDYQKRAVQEYDG